MQARFNLILLLGYLFTCIPFIASGKEKLLPDSSHYRKHVRYVLKEHKKLEKHLAKVCRKEYPDSAINQKHREISTQYASQTKHFSYLVTKKCKAPLSRQYRESEIHKGIIERTYKQLDQTSKQFAGVLLAKGYAKEAAALQKQSFYSSGKYQYYKRFHASSFLDAISADKINALKKSQNFTLPVMNASKQTSGLTSVTNIKQPKLSLPENLQTNAQVNQVFAYDKPAAGQPAKKQKFQDALSGKQLNLNIDTTLKDTMLFRPNPYRLMPWQERIKTGGNFEAGSLLTGGKKFSYTINLTWLLSPNIKPVIGIGYQHSFAVNRNNVQAEPVGFSIKAGAEFRLYKAFSVFGNFENDSYSSRLGNEGNKRKTDFVIGLTNDTGKKRLLKIWIGVKLGEIAERNANPFVFRVGL
jgi:hypothetical protein